MAQGEWVCGPKHISAASTANPLQAERCRPPRGDQSMNRFWIVLAAVLVGTCSSARADIIYNITMNTSPLIGHAAGPFSLEFQFNDGEGIGDGNNTVLLSSFLFGTGGSAAGSASTAGNVIGDLGSSVQFTDTVFFN